MRYLSTVALFLFASACMTVSAQPDDSLRVESPGGTLAIDVSVADGEPQYRVVAGEDTVIAPSALGFEFQNAEAMDDGFEVLETTTRSVDTTWRPVWGTEDEIRNAFHELTVRLQETAAPRRRLDLVFRAYDDGVAFRYIWPDQPNLDSLKIASEKTEFRFTADHTSWWIPDDYDGYEWVYEKTPLSAIVDRAAAISYNSYLEEDDTGAPFDSTSKQDDPGAVNTPITMRHPDGERYLSVHEAALTDYASMTLQANPDEPTTLHSNLVPWPDGIKVKATVPHRTPWRTIQVTETPGGLIESHLIQNLNEPSKIEDPSWIEPMTYIGIWWGMHIGKYSWGRQGTHGATTERTKRYMDFAAKHDIDAVLVEGWNTGWESWQEADNFDFTESYPDFDLEEVTEYGRKKGVALIGHHETGGDVPSYERQREDAFALYDSLGVPAVKTGYAGPIRPKGVHHHSQPMVNHYREVVKIAAKHEVAINAHEPIKPTGIRRTWPNMMTREGVRGMEYNAWSEGNPPSHAVTVPFTRMLAGPLDYTPGIVNLTPKEIMPKHRVRTTLAKQLANLVILYSPVQMAADLIEHYEDLKAVEFIERVPADWSESHVVNARIGKFITIARRKEASDEWFVGTTTDGTARRVDVPLDFLDAETTYVAHVFEDTPSSDWKRKPHAHRIRRGLVTAEDTVTAAMGRSGGQALILTPATEADEDEYAPLGTE